MSARILEISHAAWVKLALPEQTEHVDTSFITLSEQGLLGKLKAAGAQVLRLVRLSFQRPSEVVVCRCLGRFIYRPNLPLPINAIRWLLGLLIRLCVWSQVRRGARLAVVDHLDEPTIDARDLPLLRLSTHYFKRELPQNTWNVYLRVQPRHGQIGDLSLHPGLRPHVSKFLPLSLGISGRKIEQIEAAVCSVPEGEKTLDVFYAGPVGHSTVRLAGMRLLEELGRRGFRVDASEGGLPFEEFARRMRLAWLVWSPEGHGWDCYRHYEVGVAGSVPLMNYPTIHRYQPLLDGVHCVHYAVEGDDLCRRAERALEDQPALRRMAAAARAHVLAFHTEQKQGLYIAERLLRGTTTSAEAPFRNQTNFAPPEPDQ